MSKAISDINARRAKWYQIFKYTVYLLLFVNLLYFLREDYLASAHTFRDGITLSDIGNAFAAFVDTIAWLVLLLMLELETYVLEDKEIVGLKKWVIHGVSVLCYGLIIWAWLGYQAKAGIFFNFEPITLLSACDALGQYMTYVVEFDDYVPLTPENCMLLGDTGSIMANIETSMVAHPDVWQEAVYLAVTDIVNSTTWILVVLVLGLDVIWQLRGTRSDKMVKVTTGIKAALYLILFVAMLYWAWLGDFVGFWDAFLWLVAFIFIEMNLFDWRKEEEGEKEASV